MLKACYWNLRTVMDDSQTPLCLLLALLLGAFGTGDSKKIEHVMAEMRELTQRGETADVRKLAVFGNEAIPHINKAIEETEHWRFASYLFRVLRVIGTREAARLLLDIKLYCHNPEFRQRASVLGLDVPIPIKPEEVKLLTTRIHQSPLNEAVKAAAILVHCNHLPVAVRAEPILERWYKLQISKEEEFTKSLNTGIPAEISLFYCFASLFWEIREEAIPFFNRALGKVEDKTARRWLMFARAFAGDKDVAGKMRQIIDSGQNKEIRCLALKAYACSAGKDAIPLLEQFVRADPAPDDWRGQYARTNWRYWPNRLARIADACIYSIKKGEYPY